MVEELPTDTRGRILQVALDAFAGQGFHATSIREIAEGVGITKTAVLYHFPGKADILRALTEPLLNDLDAALDAADVVDATEARWAAVEGMLEVWLEHRYLLRMSLHDLALAAPGPDFERFRDAMIRANALVAGPDADFGGKVRAAQAIAMLGDPVVLFADAPTAALRDTVLRGVRRLLDDSASSDGAADAGGGAEPSGPVTDRAVRRTRSRRGRPSVMSSAMAETAQRMYDDGHTAGEIAAALGVSRATIYRHLLTTDE
jgi:AcrR family transcriptional regulator